MAVRILTYEHPRNGVELADQAHLTLRVESHEPATRRITLRGQVFASRAKKNQGRRPLDDNLVFVIEGADFDALEDLLQNRLSDAVIALFYPGSTRVQD